MIEHAEAFFARCAEDEALRERLREAEENYPGSLEIREAVVEDVLLPIARELGFDFTLEELRTYETRLKLRNARPDLPVEEDEEIEDPWYTGRFSEVYRQIETGCRAMLKREFGLG